VQWLAHRGPNDSVIVKFDTAGGVPKMGVTNLISLKLLISKHEKIFVWGQLAIVFPWYH
jgi:hypothetical protein